MKIEDVKTYLVQDWLLVQISTDSGIVGVGQGTFWGQPAASEQALLSFKSYLIGKDPLTIDYHYQYLNRSSSFRASAIYAALSAIDAALWDIAGKHYGAPAYTLMGGSHRHKIRMCALCMDGDRDAAVALAAKAADEGHTAVKIDPFPGDYPKWSLPRLVDEVVDRVGAVREAVGRDVDIVVEVHRKLGPAEAIAVAQRLEQFDLLLIEDPIPPDSADSMAEVASRTTIPIATGERLHTIYEFREILSQGRSARPQAGRRPARRPNPVQEDRRAGRGVPRHGLSPQRLGTGDDRDPRATRGCDPELPRARVQVRREGRHRPQPTAGGGWVHSRAGRAGPGRRLRHRGRRPAPAGAQGSRDGRTGRRLRGLPLGALLGSLGHDVPR